MVDIAWPQDLVPYRVAFWLQAHVGGQESPITRTKKTYGLSAPRWVARLTFRGGYDGEVRIGDQGGYGPRLDAMLADLQGGLNIAVFHDWRRPRPTSPMSLRQPVRSAGAPSGATSMQLTGFSPRSRALSIGDYVGGDGRPHLISAAMTIAAGGQISGAGSLMADASGSVIVGFHPPLDRAVPAGALMVWPVTGRFELVDPDAANNEVQVGENVQMTLDFVEKLA